MTTYRTGNPLGSADPKDLFDNAQNFDRLINDRSAISLPDRLGNFRRTYFGFEEAVASLARQTAYQYLGAYQAGLVIEKANQIFLREDEYWSIGPSVPLPYTTSGEWSSEAGLFLPVGDANLRSQLTGPDGDEYVGHQEDSSAPLSNLKRIAQETLTPQRYMTAEQQMNVYLRLATIDISGPVQQAFSKNRAVRFPAGAYRFDETVNVTGRVIALADGDVAIFSDKDWLSVLSSTSNRSDGSRVSGFKMYNITAPWVVRRQPADWSAPPDILQSNADGCYQPTNNDADIWASLTAEQKNQNIGCGITFRGNSKDIRVSDIGGRFVNIGIFDSQQSVIERCNIKAGKQQAGLLFWNIDGQEGRANIIRNNIVRDASNNGWAFARNYDGIVHENYVEICGESGGKFWQDNIDGTNIDAACYRMSGSNCQTVYAFYDGFDFSSSYSATIGTRPDSRHNLAGFYAFGCRGQGIYKKDGGYDTLRDFQARKCGLGGITIDSRNCQISDFDVYDCVDLASEGANALQITGDGHNVKNLVANGCINASYSIYMPGNNVGDGVHSDGVVFVGNRGSIAGRITNITGSNFESDEHTWPLSLRQNSSNGFAMRLYSEDASISTVTTLFHPRLQQLPNPIASHSAIAVNGTAGSESGRQVFKVAYGGVLNTALTLHEGRGPGAPFLVAPCPPGGNFGPNPFADLEINEYTVFRDDATDTLRVFVKRPNGSIATGVMVQLANLP